MASGRGIITRSTTNGPFTYSWVDDTAQEDFDTVVVSRTIVQAYNEVGALAQAMPGTIKRITIIVVSE